MSELLDLAVAAHGGAQRWGQLHRFEAAMSITGAIWQLKGVAGVLGDVVLAGSTRDQQLTISPFRQAGWRSNWTPGREIIESDDGHVIAERDDPLTAFAGHTRQTPWDDFHLIYFASYANWNYVTAPFLFRWPGFTAEEAAPWQENGETWRSLLVTYPDRVAAHSGQQTYYFDDGGLLRRIDYSVDILGGGPAAHYPSQYREFDGVMVPTSRRVYVRNPDGTPARDRVSIAIDVSHVSFT